MVGNVKPKKFLGQHFLIDKNISKKIIESIDFNKHNKVIEVGPGKGALTQHLLKIKDILTLVEIDKECIFFLKNEFIILLLQFENAVACFQFTPTTG